jgi:YidC/Oxa1 family membrane protein insertase
MDSNTTRTLLAIVLSMAVLIVWQTFLAPKPPIPQRPDVAQTIGTQDGGVPQAAQAPADRPDAGVQAAPAAETGAPVAPAPTMARAEEKLYLVENELWQAVFTDRGAALKSFNVKKYRVATKDPRPVDLVAPVQGEGRLPLTSGFDQANFPFDPAGSYTLVSQTADALVFKYTGPQVDIEKKFSFGKGEYVIGMDVTVKNTGGVKLTGKPQVGWTDLVKRAPSSSSSWFAPSQPEDIQLPTCLVNDKLEKAEPPKQGAPEFRALHEGRVMWAGADSRYFLAAIVPQTTGRAGCAMSADGQGVYATSVIFPPFEIEPGKASTFGYRVFAGPKDLGTLRGAQSGLDRAVDYGWLSVLCMPMLWLLRLFFSVVGNYGVAIVLLTILVKVLSLPLTNKSLRSMQEMAKLKPKMDELNKKHKDDKQKLNEEMMKLYQQHGISPLSGCLPMLLQMPIWIALYRMLWTAVELYQAPCIPGWLDNLAEKDPTYILPILLGVGMYAQQKITPTTMDSTQAKVMLYFMPVFFTIIMLSLPSGLTLYIFVNTVLSVGQQIYNNRKAGPKPAAPAAAPAS